MHSLRRAAVQHVHEPSNLNLQLVVTVVEIYSSCCLSLPCLEALNFRAQ